MESESGGLLVLDDTSLLRTVLVKAESVLRDKNLNNYTQQNTSLARHFLLCFFLTYLHEEVVIKIRTLCVLLVLILESTSCS